MKYTLTELLVVVGFVLSISVIGVLGYVVFHFLQKIW